MTGSPHFILPVEMSLRQATKKVLNVAVIVAVAAAAMLAGRVLELNTSLDISHKSTRALMVSEMMGQSNPTVVVNDQILQTSSRKMKLIETI